VKPQRTKIQTRDRAFKILTLVRHDATDTGDCCSLLLDLVENQTIWIKLLVFDALSSSDASMEFGALWGRESQDQKSNEKLSLFHMSQVAEALAVWEAFCRKP